MSYVCRTCIESKLAALAHAVIHNADAGASGVDHDLRIRGILPMMESRNRSTTPMRLFGHISSNSLFLVRSPQMDGAEFSKSDMDADRHRVLGVVLTRLETRAIGIGSARTRQCRLNSGKLEKTHMVNQIENISTSVFAYLRTSSAANMKGDNTNADSDTRQRAAIEAYAASCSMTVAAEFYDAAVSGADPVLERDGFRDMLDKCAEMGVKVILVENASRFARDVVVQETGLRMLRGCGVSVIPVDAPDCFQDDPNNPTQTLIRQILGAVAQFDKQSTVVKLHGASKRRRPVSGKRTLKGEGQVRGASQPRCAGS